MFLATDPDFQGKGYGKAAIAAALHYFREHAEHAQFGLWADTYEERSKSERHHNRPAVTYWRDKVGMSLNPDEPPKMEGGEVTERWMDGDVAKSLEKIGAPPRYRVEIVDAGAYDAIRCKDDKFELHYTFGKYGWSTHSIADIGLSTAPKWESVEPVLRGMGISRQNVEDALKRRGKTITLCAGAREASTAAAAAAGAPIAYRQEDILETDLMCVAKAAASGLASKGHTQQAEGVMAAASNDRSKMATIADMLNQQNLSCANYKARDMSPAGVLDSVRKKVEARTDLLLLGELVDGNGRAGHSVVIDCGRGIIIDQNATADARGEQEVRRREISIAPL